MGISATLNAGSEENMLILTDQNYDDEIKRLKDKVVVVDFWAEWCQPCKMMVPVLKEVSKAMPDVQFAKLDTETNQLKPMQLDVMAIPVFFVYVNGQLANKILGFKQPEAFKAELENIIAAAA